MKLALFDLDHTLLPLDSDHAWGQFTVQLGWRDAEQFAKANDAFYQQYKAGTLDLNTYIRFGTQSLRDLGDNAPALAAQAHQQFMAQVVLPAIRPQATALLDKHRRAGDEIVLVTATNAFITAPIAQALGIAHLIAVNLVLDEKGVPTGDIAGTPSFREGKVTRVEQWLADRGLNWADLQYSYFYSDSINDLPLLERATHPVATNPDDRLKAIATERGWPVLDLFND